MVSIKNIFIASTALVMASAEWASDCYGINGQRNSGSKGVELNAWCRKKDQAQEQCSKLNLNYCIKNFNGSLVFSKDGGFAETCFDCFMWKETKLYCNDCKLPKDRRGPLEIDTNEGDVIQNEDGYLACYNAPTGDGNQCK